MESESESRSVVSDLLWPHGILQVRKLEWVAFLFSRGSSWPRDWTQVSRIAGRFFTSWVTREAQRITVLPYCAGFCHRATWISHRYTYGPSLLKPLPPPIPLYPSRLSQSPGLGSGAIRHLPSGYLFFIWLCICIWATLPILPTLSFPPCGHSLFSTSGSPLWVIPLYSN